MLSVHLLQCYVDQKAYERLIEGLASNDVPLPLPLRARLAYAAPSMGLGLRRLVELTHGPTSLSRSILRLLIHLQRPDGACAGSGERCPLATAAVAAGMGAVLREHAPADEPALEDAYHRAAAALGRMQNDEGLFAGADDRTRQDRALTSAFVLVMLADEPAFRTSVRFAEVMTWFDEHASRLDRETRELYHLARAGRTPTAMLCEEPAMLTGIAA